MGRPVETSCSQIHRHDHSGAASGQGLDSVRVQSIPLCEPVRHVEFSRMADSTEEAQEYRRRGLAVHVKLCNPFSFLGFSDLVSLVAQRWE